MLAMLNHSLGININKSIIKVSMEIVIVKELDNIIFFVLNVSFSTKTLFLRIFPCKLIFASSGFIVYSDLSKNTCLIIFK
jgi:hypothetical protein